MEINTNILKLSVSIFEFIQTEKEIDLLKLKLKFECTGTDLLLAIGVLINEKKVILERKDWQLIVKCPPL